MEKIKEVVIQLQTHDVLDSKLRDHALIGEYKGFRECHIFADLVIVYKRDTQILTLYRIGADTKSYLRVIDWIVLLQFLGI